MAPKPILHVDVTPVLDAMNRISGRDAETQQLARRIVRGEIIAAKMAVGKAAQAAVGQGFPHSAGDPRQAWRGIVANIWSRLGLGGSIALQHTSYNTETKPWNPARKGTRGQRNISGRTQQVNEYWGRSRGFILRFLNNGTADRVTGGRNNRRRGVIRLMKRPESGTPAYRGKIKGNRFFERAALPAAERAVQNIGERIASMLEERFGTS